MNNLYEKIIESANYIKTKTDVKPTIGLILGSGLGVLGDEIENPVVISYNEYQIFQFQQLKDIKAN
ncbi:hypothetical protein H477_5468 [[Clostridium] sordellii ATCC 9714]|nr:hypothetical protein H477_5468 [[Clostridium] sordellii ATCC 9714] [Paeniclostridium sordellii ATCC 9714]